MKRHVTPLLYATAIVALVCFPSLLGAETVFRIVVQQDGDDIGSGLGVLVSNELVLTNSELVALGNQILAEDAASGARTVSTVAGSSDKYELALLAVPGLEGEAAQIASQGPEEARQVHLLAPGGTRREGTFHSEFVPVDAPTRYQFTAAVGDEQIGAPLMNNCGELLSIAVGMSVAAPGSGDSTYGLSGSLPDLIEFLTENEVEYATAADDCQSVEAQLSEAEEAKAALEDQLSEAVESEKKAAEEKAALEEQRAELEAQLKEIEEAQAQAEQQDEKQKKQAQEQRARLQEQLKQKEQDIQAKAAEIEAQEQARIELEARIEAIEQELQEREEQLAEQEQRRLQQLYIFVGVGILLALLCGFFFLKASKRKKDVLKRDSELRAKEDELKRAAEEIAQKGVYFPDVLLSGSSPDGEIRVKVNGTALARAQTGQVIGRSARDAHCVISEGSVSRRHAILRVSGDSLTIEDAGSLNGTTVNGARLPPGQAQTLSDGSTLELGDVELTVTIVRGAGS